MNRALALTELGQSLWYDNIQRSLLKNGGLRAMVERGEIRGVTSNPTIFMNAITKSTDYDESMRAMLMYRDGPEEIFFHLAIEDIAAAADVFRPLYDSTQGGDGYVSLEVSPRLAADTAGTLAQARSLWKRVNRPNLMIKIPATREGLPAIRDAIADGINVNVTLIFGLERYNEVMDAYLSGLEKRAAAGQALDRVASVASFFISRIDSKIDPLLDGRAAGPDAARAKALRGRIAIANAKLAYAAFQALTASPRWRALAARGARVQRPLWASTGTKDKTYSDVLYVDALIGPDTVNTVPPATLSAFLDHGTPAATLTTGVADARAALAKLKALGIDLDAATAALEREGTQAFSDAFNTLLQAIAAKTP
ncbi:MAG: transaldolase [Thermoflexales bacterium]|nr:transaldolase [Thermoflexales bacterium]